jgi:DNA (cytosine-5)-methyltransferase 1
MNLELKEGKGIAATSETILPAVVSLFAGAGGLDLGFRRAGFEITLAFDSNAAAVATYRHNFTGVDAVQADLAELGPGGVLAAVLEALPPGSQIGVIGGPPCQGFSRANTAQTTNDPRNLLPDLFLDVIQALRGLYAVEFVVFENVPALRVPKHVVTYQRFTDGLAALGFDLTEQEHLALDFGVAQRRTRLMVCGLRQSNQQRRLDVQSVADGDKTVRDAIGRLGVEPTYFRRDLKPEELPLHPNHWAMTPKSERFATNLSQSDGRSFKRLSWDSAAPTMAFGHREMHVHPSGVRRISVYEAMLLQGFPPDFVLKGNFSEQVDQVSNAVPPPLATSIAKAVVVALRAGSS